MRNDLNNIQRCPGCGGFITLAALKNAIKELEIPTHNLVVVSGIGCTGKISQYIDCYACESLHGRTLPFATGVKLSNPHLTVIAIGGDGDGYGIGIGHFIHTIRRNINITYIVSDNENYALTTGQASATSPIGAKTKSTPQGNTVVPINPTKLAIASGCNYSKELIDLKPNELKEEIKNAIKFEGFSHLNIKQNCVVWKKW